MKAIVGFLLALIFSSSAIACDQAAAMRVQSMFRDMAVWYEKDGAITVKWGADWDHSAPPERLELIRAFADTDVCLNGRPREISFYRYGKLVGKASPSSGIHLVK